MRIPAVACYRAPWPVAAPAGVVESSGWRHPERKQYSVIDIVTFGQEVFAAFDLPRSI